MYESPLRDNTIVVFPDNKSLKEMQEKSKGHTGAIFCYSPVMKRINLNTYSLKGACLVTTEVSLDFMRKNMATDINLKGYEVTRYHGDHGSIELF